MEVLAHPAGRNDGTGWIGFGHITCVHAFDTRVSPVDLTCIDLCQACSSRV